MCIAVTSIYGLASGFAYWDYGISFGICFGICFGVYNHEPLSLIIIISF